MRKKNLFTAVGRLTRTRDQRGIECPMIILGGKEYLLDLQELLLWTCLNWRIVKKEEINALYDKLSNGSGYLPSRTLDACINRMITRGLIVSGSGETEYDALYDLLSSMYIVPICDKPLLQFLTVARLVLMNRVKISIARKILRRDQKSADEKRVMDLARQALLSTAEIIRCIEMDVTSLPDSDSIMEAIYNDRETTSDNIGDLVKAAPCTKEVLVAVANLYLRKQLIFDRV